MMKKVNNKANNEEYNSKMKIKSKNNKANASNENENKIPIENQQRIIK